MEQIRPFIEIALIWGVLVVITAGAYVFTGKGR